MFVVESAFALLGAMSNFAPRSGGAKFDISDITQKGGRFRLLDRFVSFNAQNGPRISGHMQGKTYSKTTLTATPHHARVRLWVLGAELGLRGVL